jgi:hypothetical protein
MPKKKSKKVEMKEIPYEESIFDKIKSIFVKIALFLLKHEYRIWQILYDFSLTFVAFSYSVLLLSQVNRLLEWYYLAIFTLLGIAIGYLILKRLENLKKGMQKA